MLPEAIVDDTPERRQRARGIITPGGEALRVSSPSPGSVRTSYPAPLSLHLGHGSVDVVHLVSFETPTGELRLSLTVLLFIWETKHTLLDARRTLIHRTVGTPLSRGPVITLRYGY